MRWNIGDVVVTKIVELETTGGSRFILPDAAPDAVRSIPWLIPHFADEMGKLKMSIHALIVETPDLVVMVDTCLGNDKKDRKIPTWNDRQGRFLADIGEAGYPQDKIDVVMCTHLHVDHVGWNTMLVDGKWVPTFPKARYIFGRAEFDHWSRQREAAHMLPVFADSVQPIVDAGLAELVEADHRLCDEIRFVPSHGHSPGHCSVLIESKGERALITGDFAHHPCQFARLDWCSSADFDRDMAKATRERILAELAGTRTLVIGTHFAGPTAGRVLRDGNAYKMEV
ncbi:MAG: MBL fold metallo-hydrolase [Hyphomicrobiaceae bacterium]